MAPIATPPTVGDTDSAAIALATCSGPAIVAGLLFWYGDGAKISVWNRNPATNRFGFSVKGSAGLIVSIAVIAILLVALPAYRIFFLISVLIGLVIAGGLALWHKLHPIEEPEGENKRPLGL